MSVSSLDSVPVSSVDVLEVVVNGDIVNRSLCLIKNDQMMMIVMMMMTGIRAHDDDHDMR